ncbi:MAG: hypothetical protein HY929_08465 [Euryarchaeota archaeon]|nr:hypothetical protein [Euryarchaeota archaeon]
MKWELHNLPLRYSRHAAIRLKERYKIEKTEQFRHYLKVAKIIRRPEKEGSVGTLETEIGESVVKIEFTIRRGWLWVITVK